MKSKFFIALLMVICGQVALNHSVAAIAAPTFVVDSTLSTTEQTYSTQIRTYITQAASDYGVSDFTAVIFAPTSTGAAWAESQLASINCSLGNAASLLSGTAVGDVSGGRCIVYKAVDVSYPTVAKDIQSVAHHEVFHVVQGIRSGRVPLGARFDDMRWLYEGTAEIAGYQPQIAAGKKSQTEIIELLIDSARRTTSSLTQVSNAWVDNSITLGIDAMFKTNTMYSRSYLASYYLSTLTTSQKVMNDYFAEAGRSGDHNAAFTTTFGMTVNEFDTKFATWITSWSPPKNTSGTITGPVSVKVAPKFTTKKPVSMRSVAAYAGLSLPNGSTISVTVSSASKKFCRVAGTSIKALKKGTCKLNVTVRSKSGKKTSRTTSLTIAA